MVKRHGKSILIDSEAVATFAFESTAKSIFEIITAIQKRPPEKSSDRFYHLVDSFGHDREMDIYWAVDFIRKNQL